MLEIYFYLSKKLVYIFSGDRPAGVRSGNNSWKCFQLDDDGINAGESYLERRSLDGEREAVDEEEYMDLDAPTEILGKLDKRQQSDLKDLETYLEPATHTSELEKLRKLEELRVRICHYTRT